MSTIKNKRMKKINSYLLFVILMIVALNVKSQQDPMFTQYMSNTMSVNPAYAGSSDMLSINLISRHQWIGLDGAPQTQTLMAHTPLVSNLGAGISLLRDQVGPVSNFSGQMAVSYKLKLSTKSSLSFGLMAGVNNSSIILTDVPGVNPTDVTFQQNINSTRPIFGSGLYFLTPKAYLGISVPDLIETIYYGDNVSWKHNRHYFIIGGGVFNVSKNIVFKPTFLFKYVNNVPFSAEFTSSFIFKNKLWLGAMYRYNDAVGAIINLQLTEQLRLGYAYDYSVSRLRLYHNGTHEIMLNYDFRYGKKSYATPRYF